MSSDQYIYIRNGVYLALDVEVLSTLNSMELTKELTEAVVVISNKGKLPVTQDMIEAYVKQLSNEILGLGPIQELIDDSSISDILVNGPETVFIEKAGVIHRAPVRFIDENQLINIAKKIANLSGRRVDELSPICDARLSDGSRVNIVLSPVSLDGTSISIRKFKDNALSLDRLVGFGTMSDEMCKFLKLVSSCRANIVVSGGTGSGKTTLLNALTEHIRPGERIVTIEDAAELKVVHTNVVRLETRVAGTEGTGLISARDLLINSLRMRPDRIIVGECRGAETFEMLQAMNTGHDGSMSTLHANGPIDAISRIESMAMMSATVLPLMTIRKNAVNAIDLIIQVERLSTGKRKITSITELLGFEGDTPVTNEVFKYTYDGGARLDEGSFVFDGFSRNSRAYAKVREFGLTGELERLFN